jgi:4-hydroxy-2-oxoheptanedioate aldolase
MGVPPRAEIGSAEQARRFMDIGVRHFCIGTDISILFEWWKNEGEGLRRVVEGA